MELVYKGLIYILDVEANKEALEAYLIGKKFAYTEGISDRSYQQNGDRPSRTQNTNTFKVESSDSNDFIKSVDIFSKNGKGYEFIQSRKNSHMWFLMNSNIQIGGGT